MQIGTIIIEKMLCAKTIASNDQNDQRCWNKNNQKNEKTSENTAK